MRDDSGRFQLKGDEPRILRSIRLTDTCWDGLLDMAESQGISRSDLLEQLVENADDSDDDNGVDAARDEVIQMIQEIRDSLEPGEDPIIDVDSRYKASGRRLLDALIEYLESM